MQQTNAYERKGKELVLIPKYECYMEYMLENVLLKLPRTEKFSIGTEFKSVMYDTFKSIMYIEKIMAKDRLFLLNRIDAGLNIQRAFLRIMKKQRWIDQKKFDYIINTLLREVGMVLGGLIKFYAQNIKK